MKKILNILSEFDPITLHEMGSVKLMDRRDTKFVFLRELLPSFLDQLKSQYRVVEVHGVRVPRYLTTYFDTDDFLHFQHHHTKRLNRYKVRIRTYLESNETFFEIKYKNNHFRTIKNRIPVDHTGDCICEKSKDFLALNTPIDGSTLSPKLRIRYSRITLVNKDCPERVTLDIGLHFEGNGREKSYEDLVVAEVKQGCRAMSPFSVTMRDHRIRPLSVSKYCLGIACLYSHVRHNLMKPKIRLLNKYAYASGNH
jgi:hypothetical protein